MTHSFQTLGLRSELLQSLTEVGYEEPTAIQIQTIPLLLNGQDVLGQAQTGTGKTAAFSLPMLNNLDTNEDGVLALVLTPTRELTNQVAEAIFTYGQYRGFKVLPIVGGQSYSRQINRLQKGVHVVVGTPGRVIDLINQKALNLSRVQYLVLDEADTMLDMGFIDDVETIINKTPNTRQTALFSATFDKRIQDLSKKYMKSPTLVAITPEIRTVEQTEQRHYHLKESSKIAALTRILEVEDVKSAVIFTRTKVRSAELAGELVNRGYPAEAFHGDLTQVNREIVLKRFRNGEFTFLVATDVVARGIDIQDLSHVINFDTPMSAEDYVHRIGRTGRAGKNGVAITFVTPADKRQLQNIERFIKMPIPMGTLPSPEEIHAVRDTRFFTKMVEAMDSANLDAEFEQIEYLLEQGVSIELIAAAAIHAARESEKQSPIEKIEKVKPREERDRRDDRREPRYRGANLNKKGFQRDQRGHEPGMVRMKLNLGKAHNIRPGDIVFTIASQSNIPGSAIGAISIQHTHTFVDVHEEHVAKVLKQMRSGKYKGQDIQLVLAN